MRVRVRLFAFLREVVGSERVELDLSEGGTAEDVWRRLVDAYPDLGHRRRGVSVAFGQRLTTFDAPVSAGDEVVFLPPVSGG
jgi:molybdopterin synthase sulfur carrier subunit